MAKAIANHAGAFFLDMSPYNLKDVQAETKKLVERGQFTLKLARDYGPVVLFIDSVDE